MGEVTRVQLLGMATLVVDGQPHILERKTAGVLAYLALEGQQPRGTVAGLLWADSPEDRAKANLRQCLHRLRQLAPVVISDSHLKLFGVQIDVLQLEQQALLRDYAPWTEARGELLAGHLYDDCPDFEDWLHHTRGRLAGEQRSAFRGLLGQSSKKAHLEIAKRWLERMPLQTDALKAVVDAHMAAQQLEEAKTAIKNFNTHHKRDLGMELPHLWSWLESGLQESPEALLQRASALAQNMQKAEATDLCLQAADLFAEQKNTTAECDALLEALGLLGEYDRSERYDMVLNRVAAAAHTPLQTLLWRMAVTSQNYHRGDWQVCVRHAKHAANLAVRLGELKHELDCLGYIAACQIELGQREASEETFAHIVERAKVGGDSEAICVSLNNLSFARDTPGRSQEVIALLLEALEVAEAGGLVDHQLVYLNQLAFNLYRSENADALHYINRALALHQRITGEEYQRARTYKFLGDIKAGAADYHEALEAFERGLEISRTGRLKTAHIDHAKAKTLTILGAFSEAQTALELGLAQPKVQRSTLLVLRYAQAQLWRYQGIGSLEKIDALLEGLDTAHHAELNQYHFERTCYLFGTERIVAVQAMLRPDSPFDGYFLALAYLANNQADLALPITQELYKRLQTQQPRMYPPEIMLAHADALEALGQSAADVLAAARAWVQEKASWLPLERRAVFLTQNPFNRRLLAT